MHRVSLLLATAERYRAMAGTITDQDIAHRLIDYADELAGRAEHLKRHGHDPADGKGGARGGGEGLASPGPRV